MKNGLAAIIISAGYSSRMKKLKPLLEFDKISAIERLINTYKNAGVDDIYIVVGYKHNEITSKLTGLDVSIVYNEIFSQGMFSSIKKGISALDPEIRAYFIQPVDIPLVKIETIKMLTEQFYLSGKGVLYPTFRHEKGHPPLIDCKYNDIIFESNGDGGLKRVLDKLYEDSLNIPVYDNSVLLDMDKAEDYERLVTYNDLNAPNREECLAILEYHNVPYHIVNHCKAVERVACTIYGNIQCYGLHLDENVLIAAALLHDIARLEKNHPMVGAEIVRKMGYGLVGDIIASHMDIEVNIDEALTESELIFLADKLVKEDQVCEINNRFEMALKAQEGNVCAIKKINMRWNSAKAIIKKIQHLTGKDFIYGKEDISD